MSGGTKHLFRIVCFYLIAFGYLYAASPTVSVEASYALSSTPAIPAETAFTPFDSAGLHFNEGFSSGHLWIEADIRNHGSSALERVLLLNNPLLEQVDLVCGDAPPRHAGLLQQDRRPYLYPAFVLHLPAGGDLHCRLHVRSLATPLQFDLSLQDPETVLHHDRLLHNSILFFLGMLASLGIFALIMYLYSKDISYLYYLLYLFALTFQQVTYTGYLPYYMPLWFNRLDNLIVVPKIALMIVTAALYARSFLQTRRWERIDRIYRAVIAFALLQTPLVGTAWLYLPEAIVLTGLVFIFFNTAAAVYIYRHGNKEARFFIAAWVFLCGGYFLMILDALGFVSIMYRFPELIMAITVIEAMLLMLAFVDRFRIYEQQKLRLEKQYNLLLNEQKSQIEARVAERTDALHHALQIQKTLFRELHHRVKNNLQLILSIIRLQSRRAGQTETKEELARLQGRIETIAHTHEMLYQHDRTERVNMKEYLQRLNHSMLQSMSQTDFRFDCRCSATLPLREAVYVGLIINELFTNALKHAPKKMKDFAIVMTQEQENYRLEITTPCRKNDMPAKNGLGMTIVRILVQEQLEGTLEQVQDDCTRTVIRFKV